jgi:urea transport system substrate-binding protein
MSVFMIVATTFWYQTSTNYSANAPIKVGILHSLTGTMAISETSVVDAELMAIDEINKNGGILGRRIEPIIIDGRSDWPYSAVMAEKLITDKQVSVIFGCWTSACRKTVKPIFEKYNHLLIYPIQSEGLEESTAIVYTGAVPNQQIIPAIKWIYDHLGKRFYLIGSDYIFPHAANEIIKDQMKALGGKIVGEDYILLGSNDVSKIIANILVAKPDVIINTINGHSNIAFFRELRKSGITPNKVPTISFSIAENELRNLDNAQMVGDYAAWNYFQNISSSANSTFVKNFKTKYGKDRVTDDPIESGYFSVYLWANAVKEAGTDKVDIVKESIRRQSVKAPGGPVYVDSDNLHTWKVVRIGKILNDGQFELVWESEKPIQPVPYPTTRSKKDWEIFLNNLYTKWGNQWSNHNLISNQR